MHPDDFPVLPSVLQGITSTTESLELTMTAEMQLGSMLRTLAATRLGRRALHLGAGSGVLTAWLLDGMTDDSTLLAVEHDADLRSVLQRFLSHDPRLSVSADAEAALAEAGFDLVFVHGPAVPQDMAGSLPAALAPGGLLVVSGVEGEGGQLIAALQDRDDLHVSYPDRLSGALLASRNTGERE